jgi:hypothetical protein
MDIQNVVKDLNAAKDKLTTIIEGSPKTPPVVHAFRQVMIKLDEAYLWTVGALDVALKSVSTEAIEKAVEAAGAKGGLKIVDGGQAKVEG